MSRFLIIERFYSLLLQQMLLLRTYQLVLYATTMRAVHAVHFHIQPSLVRVLLLHCIHCVGQSTLISGSHPAQGMLHF